MYLYCICYIALVILAGLTVFRHRWNGTQILFSPFNVDRTLSLEVQHIRSAAKLHK